MIRYHPEIEDVIRPVGVAPLDLPTDDQITHTVADIVLAVNDEHYSVLYLGTGVCACFMLGCKSILCCKSNEQISFFGRLVSVLNMRLFRAVALLIGARIAASRRSTVEIALLDVCSQKEKELALCFLDSQLSRLASETCERKHKQLTNRSSSGPHGAPEWPL